MAAGQYITTAGIGEAFVSLAVSTISVGRDPTNLNVEIAAHPVMRAIMANDESLGNIIGALGLRVSFVDVGRSKMSATTEGSAPSTTNMTVTNVSLTPARYAFARSATDWARSIAEALHTGQIADDVYALMIFDALRTWVNTVVNMVVALASSATYSMGTSGAALTFAALTDGLTDMRARGGVGGSGLVLCLLSAKGVKDLQNDALALGGAAALAPQMQQLLNGGASGGYIGRFLGALDIYLCPELDADGGDTLGIAFTEEGIHTKHQQVRLPAEAISLADMGMFSVEMNRGAGTGSTTFTTVSHVAAGIRQQQGLAKIVYAT